jgi:hypothetical protein
VSAAKKKPKAKPAAKAAAKKKAKPAKVKPKGRAMMTTDKEAADRKAEKELADAKAAREARDKKDAVIANRDQDPNHPANKTPARDYNAPTTFSIPPEDMLTEQEKDVVGTGGTDVTAGVGPTSPAEHTSGPVETIEDQGIGPRTPYPEGNPPPPEQVVTSSQGVKNPDAPRVKNEPGKTTVKEPR